MNTWDEYAARWRADKSWVRIEDPTNVLPREEYLRLIGDEWGDRHSVREFVADFITPHLAPNSIVVEIGSGGGRIAVQAAPHCRWLIALDTSVEMMLALREAVAPLCNILPILMSPGNTQLPVADGSIDLAYSFDVMVHLDQRTIFRYLEEISRALKDGGVAVLHHATCETDAGWKHFVQTVKHGLRQGDFASFEYLHSATMRQMAEQVGLTVVGTTIGRQNNFYYERDVVALLRKGDSPIMLRHSAISRVDAGEGKQTGGEYTLTGPKRKAKVEIQPLVHYIWWGNPTSDLQARDASRTPNQLAGLGRVCVHYWRNTVDTMIGVQHTRDLEYILQAAGPWNARAALHGSIVIHELKSTGDPTTDGGRMTAADIVIDHSGMPIHDSLRGRSQLINAIVATMSAYNMRSAVKDFLCLLVLYRYGGWYFDTTTAITEAIPGDIVAKLKAVTKAYSDDITVEDEVKFVKTRFGGTITLMLDDRSDYYTKMLGQLPKNVPGVVEVDKIDTWGIYAPPRHPAILTMIDSYIERTRNMGLDRYGLCDTVWPPKTEQQQQNHRYLLRDISATTRGANDDEKLEIVKSERDKIIGNINIASVQEGLAKYRAISGRSVTDTTIATRAATEVEANAYPVHEANGHRVHIIINSFGIGKRHAGNWRNV